MRYKTNSLGFATSKWSIYSQDRWTAWALLLVNGYVQSISIFSSSSVSLWLPLTLSFPNTSMHTSSPTSKNQERQQRKANLGTGRISTPELPFALSQSRLYQTLALGAGYPSRKVQAPFFLSFLTFPPSYATSNFPLLSSSQFSNRKANQWSHCTNWITSLLPTQHKLQTADVTIAPNASIWQILRQDGRDNVKPISLFYSSEEEENAHVKCTEHKLI